MTEREPPPTPRRRILVALREGRGGGAALRAAAELAAELSAELVGLYVEDEQLVQAATLPVTSLISLQGDIVEPVDEAIMRRGMRVQAHFLESELAKVAKTLNLQWSFALRRGSVIDQILQSALPEDILAMEAPGKAPAVLMHEINRRASCSLFLVARAQPSARSVCVVTNASARALALGASLSRRTKRPLILLPVVGNGASSAPITQRVSQVLGDQSKLSISVLAPLTTEAKTVISQLSRLSPGHVIINRKCLADLELNPEDLSRSLHLEGVIVTEDEPLVGAGETAAPV